MRKACGRSSRRWLALVCLVVLMAALVSAPWWWTWLLWRPSSTSFVAIGPGFDDATYRVTDSRLAAEPLIPAIIHQTWKTEQVPDKWLKAQKSCQHMHPDYRYMFWTDASARELIADKYPALLPTYDAYPYSIERADVVRYAILDTYGGFYLDLDIECKAPLDFMRPYPFVMPATKPVGFSNDFMASVPKHPLLQQMLAALPRWRMPLLTKYPTVMFSTGPMFVTLQASVYLDRSALWVLPDAMYGKYVSGINPLFHHLHGSSWHGDDAKSVLWFVRHPLFLVLICVAAACGGILWLLVSMRFNVVRRWSSSGSQAAQSVPLTQIITLKSS